MISFLTGSSNIPSVPCVCYRNGRTAGRPVRCGRASKSAAAAWFICFDVKVVLTQLSLWWSVYLLIVIFLIIKDQQHNLQNCSNCFRVHSQPFCKNVKWMELVTLCTVIFQKISVGAFSMFCFSSGLLQLRRQLCSTTFFAGNRFLKFKPLLIEIEQSWPRKGSLHCNFDGNILDSAANSVC